MAAGHPDFNTLVTTTLDKRRNKMTDNVFESSPLTDRITRKGNRREVNGGIRIVEPLMYGKNSTSGFYSGWERLDLTPQEGMTSALYEWRQHAVSVAMNGLEDAQNSGEEQLIDLVEAKVLQAEESAADTFAEAFHAAADLSVKAFHSLNTLIGTTGTVGGIDSADSANAWWRSQVGDASALTAFADVKRLWSEKFLAASKGKDTPSFGLVGGAGYLDYEESLLPQLRFTSNDEADGKFRNLTFNGVPMFYDIYTVDGTVYFPNEKYFQLVTHKRKWMKNMGTRTTPDIDGEFNLILSYGNLTLRNRARQAKVTGCNFGSLTF